MVGGRCLKFVVGERCRCLWSVPMLSLLTLSLMNIGADVVEHWCRRCRCERCPTDGEARLATAHLPAQRPATASIYHY